MRGLAAGSFGEISPFQVCGSSAGQKSSRLCENGRRGKRDQGGGGGEKQIGAARDRYICWGRSIIFGPTTICTNGFMMVFGLATISTNRQPLDPMVFQWFIMVANHWQMVTIHCWGLNLRKIQIFCIFWLSWRPLSHSQGPPPPPVESAPSMLLTNDRELTERELEDVTTVFHTYETGLRTGTIHPKVEIACTWKGGCGWTWNLILGSILVRHIWRPNSGWQIKNWEQFYENIIFWIQSNIFFSVPLCQPYWVSERHKFWRKMSSFFLQHFNWT